MHPIRPGATSGARRAHPGAAGAAVLVLLATVGLVLGARSPATGADPTTTLPTTTVAPSTTTEPPTTTPTTIGSTAPHAPPSTVTPGATTGSSSSAWVWLVLAVALVAAVIAVIVVAVRRRAQERAEQAWRRDTVGALDGARLARELLPASGSDIPDPAHWQSVRERVDQAAQAIERAGALAPSPEGADSTRSTAEALRGLVFALEADRLLRDGTQAPTPEQLGQADAACRARAGDLDRALDRLDRLIHPRPDGGQGPPPAG